MSAHHLGDPIANRRGRLYRIGVAALGLLLLMLAIFGVWISLGPSGSALLPQVSSAAEAQKKFSITPYASPRPIAAVEFEDSQGRKRTLADFRGKVVLLNVWATWCGPCRKEMPMLDRLQQRLGSADFEVVALSIDRGGQAVIKTFFDEIGVRALTVYVDATAEAGTKLGIIGVPTTLLLDRMGREIGRATGPAEWDSPEVIDMIQRFLPARQS
jgi:thiol-disulfide isomerase/thioredoxin